MQTPFGLEYQMRAVLREHRRALRSLSTAVIHDLRTRLRRCRTLSKGLKKLSDKPAGLSEIDARAKALFKSLSNLRDIQVMIEWSRRLGLDTSLHGRVAIHRLLAEERQERIPVCQALKKFDRAAWSLLIREHFEIQKGIALPFFKKLAQKRLKAVLAFHRRAAKTPTTLARHHLRIALKKFRYTVENFLPSLHRLWGQDLKKLQDLLGEERDLAALSQRLKEPALNNFLKTITDERKKHIKTFFDLTTGGGSLYLRWQYRLK